MSARDASRPVPFLAAARAVFDLTLEGMVWSRRSLFMAGALALPVGVSLLFRAVLLARHVPATGAFRLFGQIVVGYYLVNVVPLAALFYAGALVADEVDGKTITYLLTRPVSRGAILAGKFTAYLGTAWAFTLAPTVLTFFILVTAGGWVGVGAFVPDLLRDLWVLALAVAVYGAAFALLGILLRRPLVAGLLLIYVWEFWGSRLPGYIPRLTLSAYLRSLVTHQMSQGGLFTFQVQPATLSLAVLLVVTAGLLGLASWIFERSEYVLEQ